MKLRHIEYGLWVMAGVLIIGLFCFGALTIGRKPVSLHLETTPRRASVWVDGNYVGTSPVAVAELEAGKHVVRVRKFDHVTLVCELDLAPGVNDHKLTLDRLPKGTLKIESTPSGAEVFVDGEFRGEAPLTIEGLGVGGRRVRLTLVNYLDWSEVVDVEKDAVAARNVALKSRTEANCLALLKANPKDAKTWTDLAHYYIIRSQWKKAEDAFTQALTATVKYRQSTYYGGRLSTEIQKVWGMQFKYSDRKKGQRVIVNAYVRAVKECPTYQSYYGQAIYYAMQHELKDKAQEVLETGIVNFPHSSKWAVNALPRQWRRQRDPSRKVRQLDSRLRKDPKDFVSRFQRVTLLRQMRKTDEIIVDYELLVPLTNSKRVKARLLTELGRMYERKRKYERAVDTYRRATGLEESNKDKAPIYYSLTRALRKLKRDRETLEAWEKAVQFQENVAVACRWRIDWAELAIKLKQTAKARRILNDVLKFSKDAEIRSSAQELIKKL